MTNDITAAIETALQRVTDAASLDEIDAVSGETLGKKGVLGGLKASLANIDDIEERKAVGRSLNEGFASVSAAIDERRQELITIERASQVAGERLDLTEAMDAASRGHLHLVTQAWQELEDVFVGLGFTVAEGPEVETDWHNFEALNMSEGHPARGEFDTLFIGHDEHEDAGDSGLLLRTHTSPVQIRTMLTSEPPIYIVAPGRVFRRDTPDATHMPVFHQIEGLVVDRDISMADLAGTIEAFTQAFFGEGFTSRLRPSYFPFTEPSAEFDIRRPDGSWLELGGCGMVHPEVLRAGGVDPEEWSGFAFGFGIDRMAVMRHGITDIRDMYVNDIRFIEQF
ncbi:MAG: phenylalanine--tRNA ligase subunit alpha [Acidimicrobiaceae bacterium]